MGEHRASYLRSRASRVAGIPSGLPRPGQDKAKLSARNSELIDWTGKGVSKALLWTRLETLTAVGTASKII